MRAFAWVSISAAVLAGASCDMYLDDIGKEGEPCAENGNCYYGLMCVHGMCSEAPGIGEECDLTHYSWDEACEDGLLCIQTGSGPTCGEVPEEDEPCLCADEANMPLEECNEDEGNEAICADGLGCFEGVCVGPLSEMVEQPSSTKLWTRCPLGMEWTGWKCEGEADDLEWASATASCPDGAQVPTVDDFIALLDSCDDTVPDDGNCEPCEDSSPCDGMFTDDEVDLFDSIKVVQYWTRTPHDGYPEDEIFFVDFAWNSRTFWSVDPAEWTSYVLCVSY